MILLHVNIIKICYTTMMMQWCAYITELYLQPVLCTTYNFTFELTYVYSSDDDDVVVVVLTCNKDYTNKLSIDMAYY